MPGAEETLAEHRERRREYADRYAQAQIDLVKKKFKVEILPTMLRVLEGRCTGIDTTRKTITVVFDPVAADLTIPQDLTIVWDRNKLASEQVVNKRVKIFLRITQNSVGASLAAIMT
jgi:hypothetical protein